MSARGPDWTRTLSRLDSNSPGGVIRPVHLLTELVQRGGDADLDITLTDGKNVWLGSIDTKQLMEYGSKHNFENLEEYLSVTHAALTGKSLCPPSDEGTKPWEFELKTEDGNMRNVSPSDILYRLSVMYLVCACMLTGYDIKLLGYINTII